MRSFSKQEKGRGLIALLVVLVAFSVVAGSCESDDPRPRPRCPRRGS